jgi:hypothetical protein
VDVGEIIGARLQIREKCHMGEEYRTNESERGDRVKNASVDVHSVVELIERQQHPSLQDVVPGMPSRGSNRRLSEHNYCWQEDGRWQWCPGHPDVGQLAWTSLMLTTRSLRS